MLSCVPGVDDSYLHTYDILALHKGYHRLDCIIFKVTTDLTLPSPESFAHPDSTRLIYNYLLDNFFPSLANDLKTTRLGLRDLVGYGVCNTCHWGQFEYQPYILLRGLYH